MNVNRFFKFGFWAILLLTAWLCFRQCGQGRVAVAFAMADSGIRNDQKAVVRYNEKLAADIYLFATILPENQDQNALNNLRQFQQLEEDYQLFLNNLRVQLLTAAKLSATVPLEKQSIETNYDAVDALLFRTENNPLEELGARTEALREVLLPRLNLYYIDLDFTATKAGKYKWRGDSGSFQNLPLTGILAFLSNLQAAARNQLTMALHFMPSAYRFEYGCSWGPVPMISPKSSFVMSGENYEADVLLSSENLVKMKLFHVSIAGNSVPVNDGIAHYETRAVGVGNRCFEVNISGCCLRQGMTGVYLDTFEVKKEFCYEVGMAHVRCEQPDNLQYLYRGVPNPIHVFAWDGFGCDPVRVGDVSTKLTYKDGGEYVLFTTSASPVTLKIGSASLKLKVRPVPNPMPLLANMPTGNTIKRDSLATVTALRTRFPEHFDFEATSDIVDFQITRFRSREDPEALKNKGSIFGKKVQQLLETTLPGDRLVFDNIRVKCSGDDKPRIIDPLSIRVK